MKKIILASMLAIISLSVSAEDLCNDPNYGNRRFIDSNDAMLLLLSGMYEECFKCSQNRIWNEKDKTCLFKENPCKKGFFVGAQYGWGENFQCLPCNYPLTLRVLDENDTSCTEREIITVHGYKDSILKQCPDDKPLKSDNGCYACDDTGFVILKDERDNAICPQREIINSGGYKKSILKQCPTDKPLRTINGCIECKNAHKSLVLNGEDCLNVCSGMFPMPDVGIFDEYEPEEKRDPTEKVQRCFSCNDSSIGFYESDCIKCSNRVFKDGKCLFKEVPDDDGEEGPLVDIIHWLYRDPDMGSSYMWGMDPRRYEMKKIRFRSCSTPYSVFIAQGFEQEAEKCQNRSMTISNKGGKVSYLTDCPDENPLRNKQTMSCLPCDIYQNIDTTEENCSQCPDRKYKNGLCIPQKRYTKDNEIMTRFWGDRECNDINSDYLDHVIKEDCDKCPDRHYIKEEDNTKGLCVTEKYLQERQAELEKSHQETLKYLQEHPESPLGMVLSSFGKIMSE